MPYAVVTGAAGGMGQATVRMLAGQGWRVFALDRKACPPGKNIIPVTVDLTDASSVADAVKTVGASTGDISAVIHFAGMYRLDSLVEMTPEDFAQIFHVNLRAAFLVNRAFLPLLHAGSRILLTTSELAPLDPLPFTGIYGVTKAALDKYAYALRMELQLLGIHVSVLRAGAVQTDMLGASTCALEAFCEHTKLYRCNAARFRQIVDSVEARSIPPEKIAEKVGAILRKKYPAFAYGINRNGLLLLLNVCPKRLQCFAIRKILR